METKIEQNKETDEPKGLNKGCLIYVIILIAMIAAAVAVKYYIR